MTIEPLFDGMPAPELLRLLTHEGEAVRDLTKVDHL
jgi:hypothetical protein